LTHLSESASTSDTEWLDKILGAHPRLGEKNVDSAQSKAEQAQLNNGDVEEATKLRELNDQYELTFPGLRYVYEVSQTFQII
jgi:2-oxo-4-hydroxy-4-carboxy--5-ureidoimidazoline (OHCU) decarboxylase